MKAKKVYFIHPGGVSAAADLFILRKKPISDKEAEKIGIDYRQKRCPYVKAFLREHPEYQFLGSSDNAHAYGWGVVFDGFTLVPPPKLRK